MTKATKTVKKAPSNGGGKREESPGFVIHDVARLMRRHCNARMEAGKTGLTQVQWRSLLILSRREGISQKTLADILELQPISVSRLIDRLQSKGWVTRTYDPDDRRAIRLYLTDKVTPILTTMQSYVEKTLAVAFAGVSESDRAVLLRALGTMRANLTVKDGE